MSVLDMFTTKPAEPTKRRPRLPRRAVVAAGAVLALAIGVTLYVLSRPAGWTLSADFGETVSIYPGSDVRVLGVRVGKVKSLRPVGRQVKVTLSIDHGVDVPAGASALVVSPSVVADRYVQLTPAYTGGPRMARGTTIPSSRTATPVELDQIYASLNRLAQALGPNGVNRNGALSSALNTGAANLGGNGQALGTMIDQLGQATKTLSGNQNDLFATLRNLQQFTTMLKTNDGQVRLAERQLAQVNGFLADDRETLGSALKQLATALYEVDRFVHRYRPLIKSNVDKLAAITQTLVDQRRSLAEALDVAPLAADNATNAYDPTYQTLVGRGDLNELSMGGPLTSPVAQTAASQVCSVTKSLASLCRKYDLGSTDLTPASPSQRRSLPPVPLPPVGDVYGSKGGR